MRILRLALSLACLLLAACSPPSAYDPSKSAVLTEEKRRDYDIQLANELATWNTNTRRCEYDGENRYSVGDCRIAFFRALAADGYEIADIASQIFEPRGGWIKANRAAFDRLYRLAEAGDKSALCFARYMYVHIPREQKSDWEIDRGKLIAYTKQGLELGLPLCALNEFYTYWNGVDGYPKDHRMAQSRLLQAAKGGLYLAQFFVLDHYEDEGFTNLHTIRKALCWGSLADQHKRIFDQYIDRLRSAAWDAKEPMKLVRPELKALARAWDERIDPLGAKKSTIDECISLEEKEEK